MKEKHLFPFFWQHGESHEVLSETLEQIRKCGMEAICVEARPHPDFEGDWWWQDLDFIMEYAREHRMHVWLLDDDKFPTGHANGAFDDGTNPHGNRFLTEWHVDLKGPAENYAVLTGNVLKKEDRYLGAVGLKRPDPDKTDVDLCTAGMVKTTYTEGLLRVSVPEGFWRIFFFYETREGNGKKNRFNILDSESVKVLLDQVYEPHYKRYREDFGKTFRGFFSDEPEFGNLPWYDFQASFGPAMRFLPWSGELEQELKNVWKEDFPGCLAELWYEGDGTAAVRYTYMDKVTKQLEKAFSIQISRWCRERGVLHIGHIIEDDNSHGRLGCSTGHYFRSMGHMGMAGIDVVLLQIMPGFNRKVHQWPVSEYDGEFFHFGLAKLGASLAQITPAMHGRALCEIFGAYGWQEDVALMKWLANHMMSRGINYFVPHAFSPAPFPDPDCPPHFYAGGNQPQFRHFQQLTQYMDRICRLISDGRAVGKAAVLYHADLEWAGKTMLYQKPLRMLMEQQLECEVIPADALIDCVFSERNGQRVIGIGAQVYEILIVPESEFMPKALEQWLIKALEEKFPVCFAGRIPEKVCLDARVVKTDCRIHEIPEKGLSEIGQFAAGQTGRNIWPQKYAADLRTYFYKKENYSTLLCFMEGTEEALDTLLSIKSDRKDIYLYDAWNNRYNRMTAQYKDGVVSFRLTLKRGEMKVFLIGYSYDAGPEPAEKDCLLLCEKKECSFWIAAKKCNGPEDMWENLGVYSGDKLPDLTDWAAANRFSGIICYTTSVNLREESKIHVSLPDDMISVGVLINGTEAGLAAGAPYEFDCMGKQGGNEVSVELYTTPVFAVPDDRSVYAAIPPLGIGRICVYSHE